MPLMIVPIVGWAWPALVPLVGAAAAALGYKQFSDPKGLLRGRTSRKLDQMRLERVALDSVLAEVVAEQVGAEERLMFERDDMVLVFRKDARGKFFVDVLGPKTKSALDLKIRAEEFARELVKKFAYHKIAEQLARRGAEVIEEHIADNGQVTLRVRQWR